MLHIQKYKAKIKGTETEVIGYIIEAREELGQECYGSGTGYLIAVTEKSMQEVITGLLKLTLKV